MTSRTVAVCASIVILSPVILASRPAWAGPCTAAIDQVQARLDARIDAQAAAGPVATESTAALRHREPTPGSIAAAEQKLGEGRGFETALAALNRAREADRSGNQAACDAALAEARQAVGP